MQIEDEIQTLREVLASKVRTSHELKRKLGISVWKELSEDVNQGLKNVKDSTVYVFACNTLFKTHALFVFALHCFYFFVCTSFFFYSFFFTRSFITLIRSFFSSLSLLLLSSLIPHDVVARCVCALLERSCMLHAAAVNLTFLRFSLSLSLSCVSKFNA